MSKKKIKSERPNPTVGFFTYNDKGEILRYVTCPKDHVALQKLRPGESKRMGKADGATQKVVDGEVVDKTPAEMAAFKKANPRLRFDSGE